MNCRLIRPSLVISIIAASLLVAAGCQWLTDPGKDTDDEISSGDEVIEIPDENLAEIIRNKLDGEITGENMERLTELRADGEGIEDLTGLEYASNLEVVWLENNEITELDPLTALKRITDLRLSGNRIRDLSPIVELNSPGDLRVLSLSDNYIDDIEPLSVLKEIQHLKLAHNRISDLSPISQLTLFDGMSSLDLSCNNISDLSSLPQIETGSLDLSGNEIKDIEPLSQNVKGIVQLDLSDNRISDISPLQKVKLQPSYEPYPSVKLSRNNITDITPLKEMIGDTEIITLDLSGNRIADISVISQLEIDKISGLDLAENEITSIAPLADLVKLGFIDLSGNRISEITPLLEPEITHRYGTVALSGPAEIRLQNNRIDTSPGSEAMKVINQLKNQTISGFEEVDHLDDKPKVVYQPQK